MTPSHLLSALAVSILAVGAMTALTYRTAAIGGVAILGTVLLLIVALGVAWASSAKRTKDR